jgi:Sec-independent protein translocase protein TatA
MIGLQPGHVLIIILVALLLFAPSRLPMVVRGMKKMVAEFRDEVTKPQSQNPAADAKKPDAAKN